MGFISVLLLIVFVIVCIFIIALVLFQNEEGDGLGGLLSMGSNSAFGSRSANVLTKATYVLVTLFFVTAFFLALVHKSPTDKGLEDAAIKEQAVESTEWWNEQVPAQELPEFIDSESENSAPIAE